MFKRNNNAMLWHVRLGQASANYLKALHKRFSENETLRTAIFDETILHCKVCKIAKFNKLPFPFARTRATRPLQIIHSDIMGPISTVAYPKGYKYISVFVDDFSRFAMGYSMKTKDETRLCFDSSVRSTRNLLGYDTKVCYLRTDQGTEFTGG